MGGKGRKKVWLNRVTEKDVWTEYKEDCDSNQEIAKLIVNLEDRSDPGNEPAYSIEETWSNVRNLASSLEETAERIVSKKCITQDKWLDQRIRSDRNVAAKVARKALAWRQLKACKKEEDRFVLSRVFKNCKNVLNKARRKLRVEFKRRKIQEIERLRFTKAGEYWKKLKELAGRKRIKKKMALSA